MTTHLKHHPLAHTRDIDEARETVARSFCRHDLSLTSASGNLDMVHTGVRVGAVGLNYLRYGDEVRITPARFEHFYLVQIPIAGRATVRIGNTTVLSDRRHASLPSPTDTLDMIWSDGCEQLIVYLDREAVERFAGAYGPSGEPRPVTFSPSFDLDTPGGRSWMRAVSLMRDEIESGGTLVNSPLASSHFEQFLIGGLLSAQPNDWADDVAEPPWRPAATTRAVRIATELIEAQPERPWRVSDLAEATGITVRQLQEAFQRDRSMGPMQYVRRTRLHHAHLALTDSNPAITTVSEVATTWGFFHLGRFSSIYRDAYGESPSHTLGR